MPRTFLLETVAETLRFHEREDAVKAGQKLANQLGFPLKVYRIDRGIITEVFEVEPNGTDG